MLSQGEYKLLISLHSLLASIEQVGEADSWARGEIPGWNLSTTCLLPGLWVLHCILQPHPYLQDTIQILMLICHIIALCYFNKIICVLVTQLCMTLGNPMDCSLSVSSVHGILQARYWNG